MPQSWRASRRFKSGCVLPSSQAPRSDVRFARFVKLTRFESINSTDCRSPGPAEPADTPATSCASTCDQDSRHMLLVKVQPSSGALVHRAVTCARAPVHTGLCPRSAFFCKRLGYSCSSCVTTYQCLPMLTDSMPVPVRRFDRFVVFCVQTPRWTRPSLPRAHDTRLSRACTCVSSRSTDGSLHSCHHIAT